jgi:putative ABC transport system substrate-binding protein
MAVGNARAEFGSHRRIAALIPLAVDDPLSHARIEAFLQGLQRLGWADGRNIRIEVLVALAPDVILAHSSPAVAALQQETSTIPIVFIGVVDPVGAGFVASLARPGSNTTGFIRWITARVPNGWSC